jgi:group I intron endonuclease
MEIKDFPKTSGIYCFENIANGKKYIGKTVNIRKRIKDHLNGLLNGADKCLYLQNAWKKHGEESFYIYVVKECHLEELDEMEKFYIREWKTKSPNGYNLTDGGDGTSGYLWSEEQRESIRGEKNHRYGIPPSEETRKKWKKSRKMNSPYYGKTLPEKTKAKMRENHADYSGSNNPNYGKHHSDETRAKISSLMGDTRGKNNHNFGKTLPEKTKAKMRENHADYSGSNNPNYGKHHSDETRAKISSLMGDTRGKNNHNFGKKSPTKSSKYYGVYYNKSNKCFVAQITLNGKKIQIKSGKDEFAVAKSYDKYIINNQLPNPLNFPEDDK